MSAQVDFETLISKGHIDADDVSALRRAMYGGDHRISAVEADALFRLNDLCDWYDSSWADFFVEAVVDYVVHQSEPHGYVSEQNGNWLIDRVSKDGIVKNATELEAMIKVLETSSEVPEGLQRFAMQHVKNAVLKGEGPTRSGLELSPGQIGRAEVDLLRRVLYACGGRGGVAVSRAEAEMLFDVNDAVTHGVNDASWTDLFVKAVANYLMATRGYQSPDREEALRREAWLDDTDAGVGQFVGKILAGGLRGVVDAYKYEDSDMAAQRAVEIASAEAITMDEAGWLADRIGKDGIFDDAERALLIFIKTESPNIHPSLKPLLDQVA